MPARAEISAAGRLTSLLLVELAAFAQHLACGLRHVHRDADRAALVGDGAGDRLADPPHRVGRDLHAAAIVELLYRMHQAHVAFLNEVEQIERAVAPILLGDGDHQAQMRLHHLLARGPDGPPGTIDLFQALAQIRNRHAGLQGERARLRRPARSIQRLKQLGDTVRIEAQSGQLGPESGRELAQLGLRGLANIASLCEPGRSLLAERCDLLAQLRDAFEANDQVFIANRPSRGVFGLFGSRIAPARTVRVGGGGGFLGAPPSTSSDRRS